MGKSWQTSLGALVCAAGISVELAQAGPAGMTVSPRPQATPAPSVSQPMPTTQASTAAFSTTPIGATSPARTPWQRIARALPDVRVPWGSKAGQAPPARPQQKEPWWAEEATPPATPDLEISLAKLSEQRGDIAGARGHFQRALSKWPGHAEALHEAALMEDRLGQFPLAERLYQQAVAANPADARTLNDLGVCLGRQGKLDQSIQLIERAVHLQPDKALYRNNAATVLVEMRQDQRAIGHLSAVHGAAEMQYNMGQLLVARNRASEAESYYRAALAVKPDMQAASAALAQLRGELPAPRTEQPTTAPQVAQAPGAPVQATPPAAMETQFQPAAQEGLQFGPQMTYPNDDGGAVYGRSAYAPPQYPVPTGVGGYGSAGTPQPNVPWVGQAIPRHLPSVGTPAPAVRR